MLYQSMSRDETYGASIFNYDKYTIEIQSSSSVYSSALMLFITSNIIYKNFNLYDKYIWLINNEIFIKI